MMFLGIAGAARGRLGWSRTEPQCQDLNFRNRNPRCVLRADWCGVRVTAGPNCC